MMIYHYTLQSAKKLEEGPGIIKVGDKAIDDHCMQSTLEGEMAGMVNKFRQLKLREFYDINKLCTQQGVTLSPALLEKGTITVNCSLFICQ
jgi:hypothetical protein